MSQPPGVPQDVTLVEVIAALRADGYDADLWVTEDGRLRCGHCHTVSDATDIVVRAVRRLEGASDPGDEAIVFAGTCPRCGRGGVATLRYGPEAGPGDVAVLRTIDLEGWRSPDPD